MPYIFGVNSILHVHDSEHKEKRMKAEIYRALYAMNQAGEDMVRYIESLRDEGVLTPHFAEVRILAARQNCAEVNVSAVHRLAQTEMDEAGRLQRERLEKERELGSRE